MKPGPSKTVREAILKALVLPAAELRRRAARRPSQVDNSMALDRLAEALTARACDGNVKAFRYVVHITDGPIRRQH